MLSWEELEPIFRRVIPKFVSSRHDYWELVAAVWLLGRVQRLNTIRFAKQRIAMDCIDYLRHQDGQIIRFPGRRCHRQPTAKKRHLDRLKSLSTFIYEDGKRKKLADTIEAPEQTNGIDQQDAFDCLIQHLPEHYQEMIRLYYEDDYSLEEIGNQLNYSPSWISQLLEQARQIIRDQLQIRNKIREAGKFQNVIRSSGPPELSH